LPFLGVIHDFPKQFSPRWWFLHLCISLFLNEAIPCLADRVRPDTFFVRVRAFAEAMEQSFSGILAIPELKYTQYPFSTV
jgi:hypothetical protein